MKKHSVCTLSLALAMACTPYLAEAASHCKGLEEAVCGKMAACKWMPEAKAGDPTKAGTPRKNAMRAHCRLDVRAAAKLAADIAAQSRSQ